jgi:hypothetical protein
MYLYAREGPSTHMTPAESMLPPYYVWGVIWGG